MNQESKEISNIEFYDRMWAEQWQDMERLNPTARHLERIIADTLQGLEGVSSVLDVGCGMGVNVKRIHTHFPNIKIVGTDLSPGILKIAENYVGSNPLIRYSTLDAAMGRLEEEFDLVLCNQVLEHIEDDRAALKNLALMARKYLLITVPAGEFNSTSKLNGHFRHYQMVDLLEKVKGTGFEVITAYHWGFPFHAIYKKALGNLSVEAQKKAGLGKYGFFKRMIAGFLYYLFYGNLIDRGDNIILLARRVS